jgi:hypothetical protein
MPQHPHFEGRTSGYDAVSSQYARYWRSHEPNARHYLEVRKAYMRWALKLRDEGLKPHDGALVIAGPGFNVADNRDFEEGFVSAHVADHPLIIVADFSTEILDDAYDSFSRASSRIPKKIRLARRDFSGGLSARFAAIIESHLDPISTPEEFENFMRLVQEQQIGVQEIAKFPLESKEGSKEGLPGVLGVETEEGMSFRGISNNIAPVRFIVSNLLLAGMFATTEQIFREKLDFLHEKFPENVTDDDVRRHLENWHELILALNTEVSVRYFQEAAVAHPEAEHCAIVDENVNYEDFGRFPRFDLNAVRSRILPTRMALKSGKTWQLDDSAETPPHQHGILVMSGKVVPNQTEDVLGDVNVGGDPTTDSGSKIGQ